MHRMRPQRSHQEQHQQPRKQQHQRQQRKPRQSNRRKIRRIKLLLIKRMKMSSSEMCPAEGNEAWDEAAMQSPGALPPAPLAEHAQAEVNHHKIKKGDKTALDQKDDDVVF